MSDIESIRVSLAELLSSQRFAVLSTAIRSAPYSNLVAFASDNDMKNLYFSTSRRTRKFLNITENPVASLLADNRTNDDSDIQNAMAATAIGRVREIDEIQRDRFLQIYLNKNPALESFVLSKDCAHLSLDVESYFVVVRFQNVVEIKMSGDRIRTR